VSRKRRARRRPYGEGCTQPRSRRLWSRALSASNSTASVPPSGALCQLAAPRNRPHRLHLFGPNSKHLIMEAHGCDSRVSSAIGSELAALLDTLEAPTRMFPAGTDQYGRDQLSRVMWGARGTLSLATVSALLGVGLGVAVGMIGAFYSGILDEILMRFMEALMTLPALLLAMLLLATVGASPVYVGLGIAIVFMPRSARVGVASPSASPPLR
jgi:ABC-type dipeptide/oligopeptide/nickel transport system permease subunit